MNVGRVRSALCVLIAAALVVESARAAEVAGIRLDDRISLAGRSLVLNGAGVRAKLLLEVYVVALYLPKRASDAPSVFAMAPRRIQMNMLLTVSSREIIDALLDTMADNSTPAELAAVKRETDRLVALISPLKEAKKGDVVTLDFVRGGTNLGWNGRFRGRIPGEAFNRALTRIWLGEKPVQPDLKGRLLGGK
ncbi:MAG TPA: chalcone isomerase family protein [Casimicrobiaceae bacterium]|nr:chalcone isomerase family protein [Casimicrobiaceae bacterium]